MNQPGQRWGDKGFTDAGMYDTRLTTTGEQQASNLNKQLKTEPKPQLLVVSPLTRTLRTAQLAFKGIDVPYIAHPNCAERVYTSAEVGRQACELQTEFGHVSFAMLQPDKPWWFQGSDESEWRPPGTYLAPGEPWGHFKARLSRFKVFLASRPETSIAVVCHFGVAHALTGLELQNCQACNFSLQDLERHEMVDFT